MEHIAAENATPLDIDGSLGEGGGQILRTALTLSAITGRAFVLRNIRARRPQPGLKPQHLRAIHAAAEICDACYSEVTVGALRLEFAPGALKAGSYRFDIGTAGSTGLVLQTVIPALAFANGLSTLTVTGGTHVPWSPSFHYLDWQWRPFLERIGINFELALERAGFYPPGGGEVHARIHPVEILRPLVLVERGKLVRLHGVSGVAKLPLSIAERQRDRLLDRLRRLREFAEIQVESVPALSAGTYLTLLAEFSRGRYCCTGLGARGKRAETVADEVADDFDRFLASSGAVDEHLADQLVIPLALAGGESRVATARITQHLLTNVEIVRRFLDVAVDIEGSPGTAGILKLTGAGFRR
jgi:RNA 3'-terminal phosphate cyclase (ATP)